MGDLGEVDVRPQDGEQVPPADELWEAAYAVYSGQPTVASL